MKTYLQVFTVLMALTLLAACASAPAAPASTNAPAPTSALAPTSAPTAAATQMPTKMVMEPTPAAKIVPATGAVSANSFNVSVAQYFLDSAGFHGMATTLADSKKVDAAYLSTVNRVKKVLVQTVWPAQLKEQGQAFTASLGSFADALTENNVDDAIKTAEVVHDAQHELSHAIDDWARTAKASAMDADPFEVSVAQYFLDSAGFHGMATTLADSKKIDATYLSTVSRVKKVLVQTTWPAGLKIQGEAFIASLGSFADALTANNVDEAIKTSDVVHDAQHELSHAIDDWAKTAKASAMDADPFEVSVAQYFLDSAGFHGMATTLADSKKIDATYLSTVNRVKKVLVQTVWPAELKEQGQAFTASLGSLADALTANNVDDAIKTSDVVHDAQHELSHAIDDWAKGHA